MGKLTELAWQLDSSIRHGSVDKSSILSMMSLLESIILPSLSMLEMQQLNMATPKFSGRQSSNSAFQTEGTSSTQTVSANTMQGKQKRKRDSGGKGSFQKF